MTFQFYVYTLRNPLKDGEPFYVGKGKNGRFKDHFWEAGRGENTHKCNTIRKITESGCDPEVVIEERNLSEANAFAIEEFLIQYIGRVDRNLGPLTNKTDGGEGASGAIRSDEFKARLREVLSGDNNPMKRDEVRAKTTGENHWSYGKPARNKGTHWTDEQRKAQSERFSGENHNMYGKPCSDARREAIRKATTGVKKSTTINMCKPRRKVECPHCGKVGGSNAMPRWHFDNCKERQDVAGA